MADGAKSTLETTKVFVPVPVEEIEDPLDKGRYVSTDIGFLTFDGTNWWDAQGYIRDPKFCLSGKEAIVLTPEQLESLMLGFADFIERKSIWGTGTGWKEHSSNELYQLYLKEEKTKP